MKQLSGLDSAFLYAERDNTPMNVIGTVILDPSTAPEGFSYETLMRRLRVRIPQLAPFRRKLLTVPFALDHPVWVDDPSFSLENHVQRVTVDEPGSGRAFSALVAKLAARRMPLAQPLWELWFIDGLTQGRVALCLILHHSAVDGISAAELLLRLLDSSAEAPVESAAPSLPLDEPVERGEGVPSAAYLTGRAIARRAIRRPVDWKRALEEGGGRALRALREGSSWIARSPLPFSAPPSRFNAPVSSERSAAYGRARLADVKRVGAELGASVNDVVLAACAASLRGYLLSHGESCDVPLVASMPISTRNLEHFGTYGNRISVCLVRLPIHIEDPIERLAVARDEARLAKRFHARMLGSDLLGQLAEVGVSPLAVRGSRMAARLGDAIGRPLHNLVLSNVPGPVEPLYAAGARVVAARPHGPVMNRVGLNLTVLSYVDQIELGVLACREAVPDPAELALGFGAAIGELAKWVDRRQESQQRD